MSKSKIELTAETWNPIVGCDKVSPGCKNCYAERMSARLQAMGVKKYQGVVDENGRWTGEVRLDRDSLDIPTKRRKPTMYFVNSMSDLFHEKLSDRYIASVYANMYSCKRHTFQVLTKRPERALRWYERLCYPHDTNEVNLQRFMYDLKIGPGKESWPIQNVWLGTSVESAPYKHRIDTLRQVPAAVRFLSLEPLLGDLGTLNLEGIHWVIAGCESGPKKRDCNPDWIRNIRDQCAEQGVPFWLMLPQPYRYTPFKSLRLSLKQAPERQ